MALTLPTYMAQHRFTPAPMDTTYSRYNLRLRSSAST